MSEHDTNALASPPVGPNTSPEATDRWADPGPPGTDMRRLDADEKIAAGDVSWTEHSGYFPSPEEWFGEPAGAFMPTPFFRGVPLGEPEDPAGVDGIAGPSCPDGVPGESTGRPNSFFGPPGATGTVGCSCSIGGVSEGLIGPKGQSGDDPESDIRGPKATVCIACGIPFFGPPETCAHCGAVQSIDLQPGEQLVDWIGDGGAPWGKCAGCGAPFTKAGGLPGNLCVRCSKQPATFLDALRAATPEKRAAAIALFNRPAGCSKNDELAAFATLRTELAGAAVAVHVGTVEQEPGEASGNYRILEPGEVIQAGDEYRISAGGKWYAVEPGSQMNGQKAPFTVVFRRAVQGGVGLYESAQMAAAAHDNAGCMAIDPAPWWIRLGRGLFPRAWVESPEMAGAHDVLHVSVVAYFDFFDRLRILISGRVMIESRVATENKVGRSKASSVVCALPPGILEDKV